MPSYQKFRIPARPYGTSLFINIVLLVIIAVVYSLNTKSLNKSNLSSLAYIITGLAVLVAFYPFTSDLSFKETLEKPGLWPSENPKGIEYVNNFIKKILASFYLAVNFPISKLLDSSIFLKDKSSVEKIFSLVLVILFFVIIIFSVIFSKNTINKKNPVGISVMNPEKRKLYTTILGLFLSSFFFIIIPDNIVVSLSNSWSYYLGLLVSLVNLIIITDQLSGDNVFGKKELYLVYGATIVLIIFNAFKLLVSSTSGKDYRILSLRKLEDTDRMNINAELFNSYNAIKILASDSEASDKFFDKNGYLDKEEVKKNKTLNLGEDVLNKLDGTRRKGFKNILETMDNQFINIYSARASWEYNTERYIKSTDKNRNDIIDGFFESKEYEGLRSSNLESLKNSAIKLRKEWLETRQNYRLPSPDTTQRVFGAGVGLIAGNFGLGVLSSLDLMDLSSSYNAEKSVLVNRYLLVALTAEFLKLYKYLTGKKNDIKVDDDKVIDLFQDEIYKFNIGGKLKIEKNKITKFLKFLREARVENIKLPDKSSESRVDRVKEYLNPEKEDKFKRYKNIYNAFINILGVLVNNVNPRFDENNKTENLNILGRVKKEINFINLGISLGGGEEIPSNIFTEILQNARDTAADNYTNYNDKLTEEIENRVASQSFGKQLLEFKRENIKIKNLIINNKSIIFTNIVSALISGKTTKKAINTGIPDYSLNVRYFEEKAKPLFDVKIGAEDNKKVYNAMVRLYIKFYKDENILKDGLIDLAGSILLKTDIDPSIIVDIDDINNAEIAISAGDISSNPRELNNINTFSKLLNDNLEEGLNGIANRARAGGVAGVTTKINSILNYGNAKDNIVYYLLLYIYRNINSITAAPPADANAIKAKLNELSKDLGDNIKTNLINSYQLKTNNLLKENNDNLLDSFNDIIVSNRFVNPFNLIE